MADGAKGLEGDVIVGEMFKGLFPLKLYIKHCRCGILFSVINVFISRVFFLSGGRVPLAYYLFSSDLYSANKVDYRVCIWFFSYIWATF